ncbi:MAG: mechanosensitive ion channel family protein [Bacteroidales bacterium]
MRNINTWQDFLITSWSQVWSSFLKVFPSILGAIVIFSIGLIVAVWVKKLVVELLKLFRLDKLTKSSGVDKYLKKAEIKYSTIELIGIVFQWLIILIFFLTSVDILGLSAVSDVLSDVLAFVPNVIAAALILAAGYIIADVVNGLVRGMLVSVDHDLAKPVGKLARWLIIVIAFFAAVDQLQIAQGLISTFFQGLTYTIVLVVGLSVGLGAKDLVSKVLNDWYEKIQKK